jgi:hypothetical protein
LSKSNPQLCRARRSVLDAVGHSVGINIDMQVAYGRRRNPAAAHDAHFEKAEGFELGERAKQVWFGSIGQAR